MRFLRRTQYIVNDLPSTVPVYDTSLRKLLILDMMFVSECSTSPGIPQCYLHHLSSEVEKFTCFGMMFEDLFFLTSPLEMSS